MQQEKTASSERAHSVALTRVLARLADYETPPVELCRSALAECLRDAPPEDNRLASLVGLIARAGASPDWSSFDKAVRRWRETGQLGPLAIRRACDAALVGSRPIDEMLTSAGAVQSLRSADIKPGAFEPAAQWARYRTEEDRHDVLTRPAAHTPAAHAYAKASYIAALAAETLQSPADHMIEPLTFLMAAKGGLPAQQAASALRMIRSPLPGYPFLANRSADDHFFFLADAFSRSRAAREKGVGPVPVIAIPKSGSAFITAALASLFDIPAGGVSLLHSFGIPSWIAFASRFPIAIHDHMPPVKEHVAVLRRHGLKRIAIHVRDPRQLVVSAAHHAIAEAFLGNAALQAAYEGKGMGGLIDAVIERSCRHQGRWLEDWLSESKSADIEVRVTTYENLRADKAGFMELLVDFLAPDAPVAKPLDCVLSELQAQQSRGGLNFRHGSSDEWRSVLTKPQLAKIAEDSGPAFARLYPEMAKPGDS